jgi:hypothetical protein
MRRSVRLRKRRPRKQLLSEEKELWGGPDQGIVNPPHRGSLPASGRTIPSAKGRNKKNCIGVLKTEQRSSDPTIAGQLDNRVLTSEESAVCGNVTHCRAAIHEKASGDLAPPEAFACVAKPSESQLANLEQGIEHLNGHSVDNPSPGL